MTEMPNNNYGSSTSGIRWPFLIVLVLVGLVAGFSLLQAASSSGFSRDVWLVLFGSAASYLFVAAADILRVIPRHHLLSVTFSILLVALVVLSVIYWRDVLRPPAPYLNNSIATFTSGKGGPARTDLGNSFSIMTDNVHNIQSKAWYERVQERDSPNGFLRLHYQLQPFEESEGFVGVFADFTLPPARPVDMSEFAGLSIRLRLSQEIGMQPNLRIVLFSDNIQNAVLAYPTVLIEGNGLTGDWQSFNFPFQDFSAPPFVPFEVYLDPQRIFRMALVVVGEESVHGHVDIDDLRLFK